MRATVASPEPADDGFVVATRGLFGRPLVICSRCGKSVELTEGTSVIALRRSHVHSALGGWSEGTDDWIKRQKRGR